MVVLMEDVVELNLRLWATRTTIRCLGELKQASLISVPTGHPLPLS
jgi:hypothetical protein